MQTKEMPLSKEHKQETRDRIVNMAGRLFRRHGYEGVGIDAIMAEAKLTRGGFYAHFKSKSALFIEVLKQDHDLLDRLTLRNSNDFLLLRRYASNILNGYLDPVNFQTVSTGCSSANLMADAARLDEATRDAYADTFVALERELARGLDNAETPDPRSLAALATAIGGLAIAKTLTDKALAEALLHACADQVTRTLAE